MMVTRETRSHSGARILYALAPGDPQEAATLATAVVRTGEYFGAYLDNKPSVQGRTTTFVFSRAPANQTIPPEQGRRGVRSGSIAPAQVEDEYVDLSEEDAP